MAIITNAEGMVTYEALQHYIARLSTLHNLSPSTQSLLVDQADRLKVIYGKNMPKQEVIQVLTQQLHLTQTGYATQPVGIEEFIVSAEYMDQGRFVRPKIMEHLLNIFDPSRTYYEVVLGGAIGIGKNYVAELGLAYDIYDLSCLFSPQGHYDLAPGSSIIYSLQSKTFDLAKKVIYQQFKQRLKQTAYFSQQYAPSRLVKAELQFPHNVTVMPVSTTDTSTLGLNIAGAIIDEVNFLMQKKKSQDSSVKSLAERIYISILGRIESRFTITGKTGGHIYMVSSTKHRGDFIDKKEKEAETNPHIYVMHMAQWESLPQKYFTKPPFFIQLPTSHNKGKTFDEQPPDAILITPKEAQGKVFEVVQVPGEYKDSFQKDFLTSVRNIAGVPLERVTHFIDRPWVQKAQVEHLKYYQDQLFKYDSFTLTPTTDFQEIIDYEFLVKLTHLGPFSLHVDLGISKDSAGLAVSHVIGSKGEGKSHFPIYGVAGASKAIPPVVGEIDLKRLGQLIVEISRYIELMAVTMDRYQAAYLSQVCRLNSLPTWIVSTVRSLAPYDTLSYALRDERIYLPPSENLNEELGSLQQDNVKGEIDHEQDGAKDMADAVAASVYNLSQRKSSYREIGPPKPFTTFIPRSRATDRPSSGRKPMY